MRKSKYVLCIFLAAAAAFGAYTSMKPNIAPGVPLKQEPIIMY